MSWQDHDTGKTMDIKTILISLAVIGSTIAAVAKFLAREYEDVRKVIDNVKNPSNRKRRARDSYCPRKKRIARRRIPTEWT